MNNGERTRPVSYPADPPLHDPDLLEEIELLTELIATATATYGRLSQQQIDEILGL